MKIKIRIQLFLYLTIAALFFAILIKDLYHRQANSMVISDSGEFLIEHVPAGGIFIPFGGMSYIKVTTTSGPIRSYRTPLFVTQYLEMRSFESSQAVGIPWIKFQKNKKVFEISVPGWKEHWLNIFISDTPYTVFPN